MALSQNLLRFTSTSASSLSILSKKSSRYVNNRSRSTQSENKGGQLIEVDLEAANPENNELLGGMRRLEDAIHGIIVRRSAPDWLPFIPGSSYWVPPRKRPYGLVELVGKLANPLSEEESLSLSSVRGWPSSSFFVDDGFVTAGASPYPVEMETNSINATQSEDEEG
ncbi:hypothetical protein IFM89_020895 [Coptis chinensis]|uniref:Uncharacterized protein n=1 Tax=Coptis chinensis TaxID=261450 RepID=A0A835IDD9_9MAGN|nr:hypothetical protein IFM89_020895 [Coptis chinensis]